MDIRKKECPAFNKKCQYCNRLHHMESMCRAMASSNKHAIFDNLCATSTDLKKPATISYTYNESKDCWDRRSSKPQPFITVMASLHTEDYKRFGIHPGNNTHTIKVRVMTDTGC